MNPPFLAHKQQFLKMSLNSFFFFSYFADKQADKHRLSPNDGNNHIIVQRFFEHVVMGTETVTCIATGTLHTHTCVSIFVRTFICVSTSPFLTLNITTDRLQ